MTHSIGNFYTRINHVKQTELYILAQVTMNGAAIIKLENGNRFAYGITTVRNNVKVTEEEFSKITEGKSKEFQLISDVKIIYDGKEKQL